MALRVLLADESSTIKKVMQLALQEYAVEVKSVPVGLDVQPVTTEFKPDIIFADVLLQKRSGYEVCKDLKADPATRDIPVVLMWSGFMEIDGHKAEEAQADARLEKPFDAETLRNIVKDLVPKTQSNALTEFLSFPEMPEFEETAAKRFDTSRDIKPSSESSDFEVVAALGDEGDDEFSTVPLPPLYTSPEDEWAQGGLDGFRLNVEATDEDTSEISLDSNLLESLEDQPIDSDRFADTGAFVLEPDMSNNDEVISLSDGQELTKSSPGMSKSKGTNPIGLSPDTFEATASKVGFVKSSANSDALKSIDEKELERLLRAEVRDVLENIAWKLLPDLAERIIREEINKLLRDTEKTY
jgi:two-component system, cell cycle response regulator